MTAMLKDLAVDFARGDGANEHVIDVPDVVFGVEEDDARNFAQGLSTNILMQ